MDLNARVNIKGEPISVDDEMISAKKVAELCGVSRSMVYKLVADFKFPPKHKLTETRVAWLKSDVAEWKRLGLEGFFSKYGNYLKTRASQGVA